MTSQNLSVDDLITDASHFKTRTCKRRSRKYKYNRRELWKTVKKISFKERRNFCDLAIATGIPKTTLHRITKREKVFKRHSSALKPILSEENKIA